MKITWNWGTKIVIAYAIFIVLIMTAVIKALSQNVDLVTPDYYAQELDYQNKYNKMQNAQELQTPVNVVQTGTNVVITFPAEAAGPYSGTILFYRPSNSAEDISMPITADANGKMVVPTAKLKTGNYSVIIDWATKQKKYFNKATIFVQ